MSASAHGSRGGWWVVGQFIIIIMILTVGFVPDGQYDGGLLSTILGALLCLVAVGFGWGGFGALGRNLTAFPKPLDDGQLVTTGVYAIVRHPIYTAVISGSMGYALLTASWWGIVLTVVLAVWFEFKSRREEQYLRDYFPTYADYAQKVAKFLPRIY